MKKLLIIVAAGIFVSHTISAQGTWGIRAGLNLSSASYTVDGIKLGVNYKPAGHLGVSYEFYGSESKLISFETGLYATVKGYKVGREYEFPQGGCDVYAVAEETISLFYAEIPFTVGYRLKLGDGVALKPFVGCSVSLGFLGLYGSTRGLFKKDYGERLYNLFDAGVRAGAALYFSQNFYAAVSYDWGLVNISNIYEESIKNRNIMITFGYNF